MRRSLRILAVITAGVVSAIAVFLVMTCPPFVSREVRLTGHEFSLRDVSFFDDTGVRGEGRRSWVYAIPQEAAAQLAEPDYPLAEYPMWSGLAFDGYRQIKWTAIERLPPEDGQVLSDILDISAQQSPNSAVASEGGGASTNPSALARELASEAGTFVACWYSSHEGSITNYFLYLINLRKRVMVKLSLLT